MQIGILNLAYSFLYNFESFKNFVFLHSHFL